MGIYYRYPQFLSAWPTSDWRTIRPEPWGATCAHRALLVKLTPPLNFQVARQADGFAKPSATRERAITGRYETFARRVKATVFQIAEVIPQGGPMADVLSSDKRLHPMPGEQPLGPLSL